MSTDVGMMPCFKYLLLHVLWKNELQNAAEKIMQNHHPESAAQSHRAVKGLVAVYLYLSKTQRLCHSYRHRRGTRPGGGGASFGLIIIIIIIRPFRYT